MTHQGTQSKRNCILWTSYNLNVFLLRHKHDPFLFCCFLCKSCNGFTLIMFSLNVLNVHMSTLALLWLPFEVSHKILQACCVWGSNQKYFLTLSHMGVPFSFGLLKPYEIIGCMKKFKIRSSKLRIKW